MTAGQELPARGVMTGLLAGNPAVLAAARRELEALWGPVAAASDPRPWTESDYYERTMGPGLLRQFLGFARPASVDRLALLKRYAIGLEQKFAQGASVARPVNIDPGLLSGGALTLASTKPAGHRIYIGDGLWAEITLTWRAGQFHPHDWTYPDFRDPRTHAFLAGFRALILPAIQPGSKK